MALREDRDTMVRASDSLARTYIIIGRLLLEIPRAQILSSAEAVFTCIQDDLGHIAPELPDDMERLREAMSESLSDIAADYAALFAGVKKLPAPPWESCYVSGKRQVCTEVTESVRLAYLQACLYLESRDAQPEVHIGLELQFLGVMWGRIAAALEAGENDLALEISAQRWDFIAGHLSRWASEFCNDLERAAGTEYYRSLARLTRRLLDHEIERLPMLPPQDVRRVSPTEQYRQPTEN